MGLLFKPGVTGRKITTVVCGGFGESKIAYQELCEVIVQLNVGPVRYISSTRWSYAFIKNPTSFPRAIYRQALHIAETLRKEGIKRVRLVDHSLGGEIGMVFTLVFGDEFEIEEVVLLNSAGVDTPGLRSLLRRMSIMLVSDMRNAKGRRYWRHAVPYLLNVTRCLCEAWAASSMEVFFRFAECMEARGAKIFFGYSEEDMVFLPHVMKISAFAYARITRVKLTMRHDSQNDATENVRRLVAAGAFTTTPERS